jgi:hopanoid biosynthesis associated protein HpnK
VSRRLIVSADDFGMSPGVNAGILAAHRDGILTAASLMVNGAGFDDAVEIARSHPTLAVGLHLVLVQGRASAPPTEIPLLAGADGMLPMAPIWSGMRYFFTRGIRDQLKREIAAQLERFAATGLPLSHVDGHLTVHVHPTVLDILLECAASHGIRAIRLPREPLGPALRFDRSHLGRKLFEGAAFAALSRRAAPLLDTAGLLHADRVYGLHQTGHVSEDYLERVVRDLPEGLSELYCHAALPDDEALRWRPADYASAGEVAALTSARVRAAVEAAGVELVSYRSLLDGEKFQSSFRAQARQSGRLPT